MEQNTNLLINVINNITVTNTILVSVAIIAGSVEITVFLNKGISFLIDWLKAKNAPYENDYHVYNNIIQEFNRSGDDFEIGSFETIEFLRQYQTVVDMRACYIYRLNSLNHTEFKKPIYKFKNKKLEDKKLKLFNALDKFNIANTKYLDVSERLPDYLTLPRPHLQSDTYTPEREKEANKQIDAFFQAKNALVNAYDEFVVACNDKFNFQIDKKPEKRY